MTQVNPLYGSIQVAVIRVAQLSSACAPISGSSKGAASKAIISIQAQAEYETGQEYVQKNGTGDLMVSVKANDKLKRLNLTAEIATRDFELIQIMTGATLITSGGTTFGIARAGIGDVAPNPVSVEAWTKVAQSAGSCAGETTGQWYRTVYPKSVWTLGDTDLGDSVATVKMTGVAEGNPNWTGNGPFNDWPFGAIPSASPELWTIDPTYTDPAAAIGSGGVLASGALGGYVAVPAQ